MKVILRQNGYKNNSTRILYQNNKDLDPLNLGVCDNGRMEPAFFKPGLEGVLTGNGREGYNTAIYMYKDGCRGVAYVLFLIATLPYPDLKG